MRNPLASTHNLKVIGSNPIPATKIRPANSMSWRVFHGSGPADRMGRAPVANSQFGRYPYASLASSTIAVHLISVSIDFTNSAVVIGTRF
jgi:hypothetical protein